MNYGGIFKTQSGVQDGAVFENSWHLLTVDYFCESSILEVWMGSEYASESNRPASNFIKFKYFFLIKDTQSNRFKFRRIVN